MFQLKRAIIKPKQNEVLVHLMVVHSMGSHIVYNFNYTGRFILFFVITNIYNKKTNGPTLMELFTVTGKLKNFFFDN